MVNVKPQSPHFLLGERERAHLVVQLRLFFYNYNIYLYNIIYLYRCRTSCPKSSTCFFFSDISIFPDLYAMDRWIRQPIDIVPSNRGLLMNQQRSERPVFSRLGARRIGESLLNQQRKERPVFSRLGARRIGEWLLN